MSTYNYMRILESVPLRYDRGIQLLSLGRITHMYDAVARAAVGGTQAPHVLEIGCGTGNLTQALLARGAQAAIDLNPGMLDAVRQSLVRQEDKLICKRLQQLRFLIDSQLRTLMSLP